MNEQRCPPALTKEDLAARLEKPDLLTEQHLNTLRWLVWLSLLSIWELGRVMGKDHKTIWGYLNQLAGLDLVDYVVLSEVGWPGRHHRYYTTDLGLYVLAARHPQPLSAHNIAMSYPVTRADLAARLARPWVHLALCALVTRLVAERPPGYRLTSYQQPYKQPYTDVRGEKHLWTCDAAFLLQTPVGSQHAFYVHTDQPEHLFSTREVRAFLTKLLALRQGTHLEGGVMPHLLVLSSPERFPFWAEQLERAALGQLVTLPAGAIADYARLREGAYAPIWTPLRALVAQNGQPQAATATSLPSLVETPAPPRLIERFSQYFTFQHLLLQRNTGALARRKKELVRYVEGSLQAEAAQLSEAARPQVRYHKGTPELLDMLWTAYHSHLPDRLSMSALLELALSDQQKAILAHLARHPYLNRCDLLLLLHPAHQDERLVTRQIMPLVNLELANMYRWPEAPNWRARERYYVREPALRYLAVRHGLSPAYYLLPLLKKGQDRRTLSPLAADVTWVQRGARLLREQMAHTDGLYSCIRACLSVSYRTGGYQVAYWKSARESIRWYRDPESAEIVYVRPDAELLYTVPGGTAPRSLLIEYDRGEGIREYERKFRCYANFQHETRSTLPTIAVITQDHATSDMIRRAISSERATDVPVALVFEAEVLQDGLLAILNP